MRWLRAFVFSVFAGAAFWAGSALAQDRYALVIGQDRYQNVDPLKKAVNDARAVAGAMQKLGFTVSLGENLTRRDFVLRVSEFENRIRPGDTAFIFYAGHGVEIDGANYLLPVDVPKVQANQLGILKDESVATLALVERLKARGTRAQIVVLDACRENPFRDTNGRSLGNTSSFSRVDAGQGVFIIYSAGLSETALDRLSDADPDPNSIFTRTLVKLIDDPQLTLVALAKELKSKVKDLAGTVGHKQSPSYYDEVDGDIYLARLGAGALVGARDRPAPFQNAPAQDVSVRESQQNVLQQNVVPQNRQQALPIEQTPPRQQREQQQGDVIANIPTNIPQGGQRRGTGFIFADSDRRLLGPTDTARLSADELRIARNEIYARKGRFFRDPQLAAHFSRFSWYRPFAQEVTLNPIENANVRYLQSLEGGR